MKGQEYTGPERRARAKPVIRGADLEPDALKSIALQREALSRYLRALCVLSGTDPASGPAMPVLSADDLIHLNMILMDATRAPFRMNGKSITAGDNAVATPGNFSFAGIGVKPPADPQTGNLYGVLVLDSVDYEGASDMVLGMSSFSSPAGQISPLDLEIPPKEYGANFTAPKQTRVGPVATLASQFANVFVDGVEFNKISELGGTAAGGPQAHQDLEGLCVWPGTMVVIQEKTVNLPLRATFHGHYWDLGSILASGLFK